MIVDAIRPTLGPLPRLVVMEGQRRTDLPEFLDDGATIARRWSPRAVDPNRRVEPEKLQALLEAARTGDTGSAEMATGYYWGEPALKPHVTRILERARRERDDRLEQLAERFLR